MTSTATPPLIDNGRGIPVENAILRISKAVDASKLVMTTLHAGGKFDSKAYETSGGLNGVGWFLRGENALSDDMTVMRYARPDALPAELFAAGEAHLARCWKVGKVQEPPRHHHALPP